MAKPKASTLQAKFGFMDEDLKTSSHDEIMSWLDKNARPLIEKILNYQPHWDKETIDRWRHIARRAVVNHVQELQKREPNQEELKKFISWQGLDEPPQKPPLSLELVWEYTVSGKNQFVVGFIDMAVYVSSHELDVSHIKYEPYQKDYFLIWHDTEPRYRLPEWCVWNGHDKKTIFFEVKSVLPTLGELIRQIRMYQEFVKGIFYVVAPDDKYAKQLQSQGIGFVKYPEGEISG